MQRVAVARALVNEPRIVLADEPTGNLDSKSGQEVMMILHDIARDEERTVLIVTHDPRVEQVADRVIWLVDGALSERRVSSRRTVTDPVCGMNIDLDEAQYTTNSGGTPFWFCSKRCHERFTEAPARYPAARESD